MKKHGEVERCVSSIVCGEACRCAWNWNKLKKLLIMASYYSRYVSRPHDNSTMTNSFMLFHHMPIEFECLVVIDMENFNSLLIFSKSLQAFARSWITAEKSPQPAEWLKNSRLCSSSHLGAFKMVMKFIPAFGFDRKLLDVEGCSWKSSYTSEIFFCVVTFRLKSCFSHPLNCWNIHRKTSCWLPCEVYMKHKKV